MTGAPPSLDLLHESGARHVDGRALYVDDLAPRGVLVARIVTSPVARGRILRRSAEAPAGTWVLFAADVPGHLRIGAAVHDEPLLADGEVAYVGQPVALVLGESYEACREAAASVVIDIEPEPPILSIAEAIAAESWLITPHVMQRGDVAAALAGAAVRVAGEVSSSAQDHFSLETHAALALPMEDGMRVLSSTQHPTEVQKAVAEVLGLPAHRVVCEVPRMGGGFGGKESQATHFAALAALGAWKTGRPVKVWLDRDQDMRITGKRHPFWSRFEAGFDEDGRIVALGAHIYADGGWSTDLTGPILDRAVLHLDNAYYVPSLRFEGRACRTNLPSNTAFRGFGGPQGMIVVEEAINRYAELTGRDPAEVRRINYYGDAPRDRTPYGQVVANNRLPRIHEELLASSEYEARRRAIEEHNAAAVHTKRGIGFQPVKFGISFTMSVLNQAGALLLVYTDGTVQLNHGGTEMGQGLHTKMVAVCAKELGVRPEHIRLMTTATDKVPNTSATAASSGSDINGQAVKAACETLVARMRPIAATLLGVEPERAGEVRFADGVATGGGSSVPFAAVAQACWAAQVSLAATGYYATPGIGYDRTRGEGTPFYYYAFGAAVTEVEVSGLTGEHRVLRVDILHDVGDSLAPSIDRGQVEGGYVQGLGWLTGEEVLFDAEGRLLTHGPSTYKIPAIGDVPEDFRVRLLDRAPQPGVIHGSKAVGEPPLMLAISAVTALRHAIAAFGPGGVVVPLTLPATPEAILRAVETVRAC
ncbi:MAG: dehydrogenase [Myxococcales bacterium]